MRPPVVSCSRDSTCACPGPTGHANDVVDYVREQRQRLDRSIGEQCFEDERNAWVRSGVAQPTRDSVEEKVTVTCEELAHRARPVERHCDAARPLEVNGTPHPGVREPSCTARALPPLREQAQADRHLLRLRGGDTAGGRRRVGRSDGAVIAMVVSKSGAFSCRPRNGSEHFKAGAHQLKQKPLLLQYSMLLAQRQHLACICPPLPNSGRHDLAQQHQYTFLQRSGLARAQPLLGVPRKAGDRVTRGARGGLAPVLSPPWLAAGPSSKASRASCSGSTSLASCWSSAPTPSRNGTSAAPCTPEARSVPALPSTQSCSGNVPASTPFGVSA
eukprot:scaffold31709_cov118-Isochrysis_galbana.AAC.6